MFPTPFVIEQLFVYCASLGSQTHDFSKSEMLNPGGQVRFKFRFISNGKPKLEHGLPSACNSILTNGDSDNTV